MNKINYQRRMEQLLEKLEAAERRPRLLLHACCAPCSTQCLAVLSRYFDITLYFYNPNIAPESEYRVRLEELRRLVREMPLDGPVQLVEGPYDTDRFEALARGHEQDPEPGERCRRCYALRLDAAARAAAEGGYDWFCSTLSVGRRKNAEWLNELGEQAAKRAGVPWLPSDFKKKGGADATVVYAEQYGLYRQNYCGCIYSKAEAALREKNK